MKMSGRRLQYEAVVIGASAGGMEALRAIIVPLPSTFTLPIIVVLHMHPHSDNFLTRYMNDRSALTVKQADEKENVVSGMVYFAPANYHLLIEQDRSFSLSTEPRVNFARPSVDVLFETAAEAYGSSLIGVILTGANNDGSRGLKKIKESGGLTIVQDPETAEIGSMPRAAIAATDVDYVLSLTDIRELLIKLGTK
jgi:two-component system, chemotaxis family, protein-glutamate methylesterase/glutaminase